LAAAIPLALLGAISPPIFAILIYYLGRESPRRLLFAYFAGAFAMTFAVGIAGISLLRGAKVDPQHHHGPSAAVDIALGVLLLAAAFVIARRKDSGRKTDKPPKQRSSGVTGAVVLGIVTWIPGFAYLSALKSVSDAAPHPAAAVGATLLLTLLVLLFVEVPIVTYLKFPEGTHTKLKALDAWFHRHARTILTWGFAIAGAYMIGHGIYRLVAH
jgi:hypothetical protein